MSSKIDLAFEMRGRGDSAPKIAASLGVNLRTVRKWWAKRRDTEDDDEALAKAEAELEVIDPANVGEAFRHALARELAAAMAMKPGTASAALGRIARATKILESGRPPIEQFSDFELNAELARRKPPVNEAFELEQLREELARRVDAFILQEKVHAAAAVKPPVMASAPEAQHQPKTEAPHQKIGPRLKGRSRSRSKR